MAHCFLAWLSRFGAKGVMPIMLAVPVTEIFELKPLPKMGDGLTVPHCNEITSGLHGSKLD